MPHFEHVRHRPPSPLDRPRELILAVPPLQSGVNLSRILRVAGCCGLTRVLVAGRAKVDAKIARDSLEQVVMESHRTLLPPLLRLREEGWPLIGLEQAAGAVSLHDFAFPRRMVLVVGHERLGLDGDLLHAMHACIEIPVYGRPYSYNVATAATMALYEYCRQYPRG